MSVAGRPAIAASGKTRMNWLSVSLGVLLGLGVLLSWQGFRAIIDKSLNDTERRRGFWKLNGGVVLAAASMIGFTWFAES